MDGSRLVVSSADVAVAVASASVVESPFEIKVAIVLDTSAEGALVAPVAVV